MRESVFAGSFYPGEADAIRSFLEPVEVPLEPVHGLGILVPHAGYVYSGATAWKTLKSVHVPDTAVILCPNHRGRGEPIAVSPDDAWNTPLGPVSCDPDMVSYISKFGEATLDARAHEAEHSLEVQLPMLKMLKPDIRIAAVSIGTGRKETLDNLADYLAEYLDPGRHLIVASSDMSHFISTNAAQEVDSAVIERIRSLDADGMLDTVLRKQVSMCGVFPAYVMMRAVCTLGASCAEVVEYTHSGKVTGDNGDVVAYLGVRIW